ncbi:MAG: outer membrane lipoprotein-sorting protein [Verrucomicrobia bacterium]|nr:outer membrane lipoprotein-sorting protein [Verrucomicrobiota bacterium]MBV8277950.1 outer membrane lipoprotein-sorting protein [Verrucomicrobiota bacterium]
MKQVKKLALTFATLAMVIQTVARADEQAAQILNGIRLADISQELDGRLRKQDGTIIPFRLRAGGDELIFTFTNPTEVLRLTLDDNGSNLTLQAGDRERVISGARLNEAVRGTDITYQDLALRFLYWKNSRVEGEQNIRTFPCWMILLQQNNPSIAYASVRVWVAKQSGALLRAEAFDGQSRLTKKFEVISGQKIEGKWFLKQMRIERYDPASGALASRTYLEISG